MPSFCIVSLYMGSSGKSGFYNSQEIGMARAMARLGYECSIIYPHNGKQISAELIDGVIHILRVPALKLGNNAIFSPRILDDHQFDTLQINYDNKIMGPAFVRYCQKRGIRFYTYSGTLTTDSDSTVKRLVMALFTKRNLHAMKGCLNFVKNTQLADFLRAHGIPDVDVAPPGLDLQVIPAEVKDLQRESYGIPSDKKLLLFVGRIDKYKHPFDVLSILKGLDASYHLIVIGSGHLDKLFEEKAYSMRLDERITWLKEIPNTEIHSFFKASDFYLNLNSKEIFGMSILEAMYQGCNVIAVHAPGPDEIIQNGINGFLVNDVSEMTDIIKAGKRLPSDVIRKRVTASLTWEPTAKKIDTRIRICLG